MGTWQWNLGSSYNFLNAIVIKLGDSQCFSFERFHLLLASHRCAFGHMKNVEDLTYGTVEQEGEVRGTQDTSYPAQFNLYFGLYIATYFLLLLFLCHKLMDSTI